MLRYAALNHELTKVIRDVHRSGAKVILDYARENCKLRDAQHVSNVNMTMMSTIPGSMFALKMTSFGSRESPTFAVAHMKKIIQHAINNNCQVCIDAEDILYSRESYDMMHEFNRHKPHVFKTYQMYRKFGVAELSKDIENAHLDGFKLGLKLVRGAYLKRQPDLLDKKSSVDRQYSQGMTYSLTCPNAHTMLATHNEKSLIYAKRFDREQYVTAQLLGLGKNIGIDYRYIPVGTLMELTPYLLRRLKERMSWD